MATPRASLRQPSLPLINPPPFDFGSMPAMEQTDSMSSAQDWSGGDMDVDAGPTVASGPDCSAAQWHCSDDYLSRVMAGLEQPASKVVVGGSAGTMWAGQNGMQGQGAVGDDAESMDIDSRQLIDGGDVSMETGGMDEAEYADILLQMARGGPAAMDAFDTAGMEALAFEMHQAGAHDGQESLPGQAMVVDTSAAEQSASLFVSTLSTDQLTAFLAEEPTHAFVATLDPYQWFLFATAFPISVAQLAGPLNSEPGSSFNMNQEQGAPAPAWAAPAPAPLASPNPPSQPPMLLGGLVDAAIRASLEAAATPPSTSSAGHSGNVAPSAVFTRPTSHDVTATGNMPLHPTLSRGMDYEFRPVLRLPQ